MTASIHNRALLYRPSLSIWTARKKDKPESSEVTERNGAQAGAVSVYKALLPENPRLEAIQKWANQFRDFVYTNTLPWDDGGWRIGTVAKHMDFMTQTGDRIREGEQLVEDFMGDYRAAIEHARFTLANLFNEGDYPGVDEVRAKFRFTVDVQTMPNAEDFRVIEGVPQDEVDKLVDIATSSVHTRVQDAMDVAYGKLFAVVSKMATTLEQFGGGEIKKFNDTLVGNIAELVDAMPALNITGDPKLAALATQARELTQYAAIDLRKDKRVRDAAIVEAKLLANAIAPLPGTTVMLGMPAAALADSVLAQQVVPAGGLAAQFADMLEER